MAKTRHPGIERLADGRYRIRARATDPRTGRMRELDVMRACPLTEAVRLRAAWQEEVRTAGVQPAPARVRLADYAESWLRSKAVTLRPSTATLYAEILDDHVLPVLGDVYLDALTRQDVIDLRDAWAAGTARCRPDKRGKRRERPISPHTVNGRLRVLRTLLADACAEYDLADPAHRVAALPTPARDDDDPGLLEAAELAAVLAWFRQRAEHRQAKTGARPYLRQYALVATLALTGCRFSEAAALRWSDVDEAEGVIHIRRGHVRGEVNETKTRKRKTVPLPAELAEVLREHRRELVAQQRKGLEAGWVFPSRVGRLSQPSALRKPWAAAMKACGVDHRVTVHGLRRTLNRLLRQLASDRVARGIIGHDTEQMTEHYDHVTMQERRAAVGAVVPLLFAAGPPTSGGSGGGSEAGAGQGGGLLKEKSPGSSEA